MIISEKSMFRILLLISLTIAGLFYGAIAYLDSGNAETYCQEINNDQQVEAVNTFIITENNNQVCDSSTGVCGPPTAWYSTSN